MRSALHSPVPSSTLLRFLKSQSEGVCFFSPNPRSGFIFDHAAPRTPITKVRVAAQVPTRAISTTTPRRATVEASFGGDFLWPRSNAARLRPKAARAERWKGGLECVVAQRNSSTRAKWYQWHRRLWGISSKKGGRPLRPDDLPPHEDTGDDSAFSLGHRISAKAAAQPKLRCTELDENGNVVLASGEFKKSELIAKVCDPWLFEEGMLMLGSTGFCHAI